MRKHELSKQFAYYVNRRGPLWEDIGVCIFHLIRFLSLKSGEKMVQVVETMTSCSLGDPTQSCKILSHHTSLKFEHFSLFHHQFRSYSIRSFYPLLTRTYTNTLVNTVKSITKYSHRCSELALTLHVTKID